MPTLADAVDLEDVPGLDLGTFDETTVDMALQLATSRIVSELGWDPFEAERTYRLRSVPYGSTVWLPALNVTAVAVTADGVVLDVTTDWWDEFGRVDLDRAVIVNGLVTYTAGWSPGDEESPSAIPQGLRDACLALAAESLLATDRLRSWTAGDSAETYDPVSPAETDPRLARYRVLALA